MKRTKQQAELVAQKLTRVFEAVEHITDEDVEYLNDTIQIIKDERDRQQALGMMIDPTKADAMIRLGKQAQNRIKGVLMIREALDETWQANVDYAKGRVAEQKMKEAFGLDFGHSGIDPMQTRQERAGAVRKLGEVRWGGRHYEITQPPMPLQLSPHLAAIFLLSGCGENGQSRVGL